MVDPPAGGLLSQFISMSFIIYALYNKFRNKIYIGHTSDLEKRLKRHNGLLASKQSSFTAKNSGVWEIVHHEFFNTREEATKREKELKSYQGRMFIKKLIPR